MTAHQTDSKVQNQIYTYLERVLPYSKHQLTNEVKEYAIKKCESEVRTMERTLQKDINQIMPIAKEKYENDVKKIEQQRAMCQTNDKSDVQIAKAKRRFPWNDKLR